MDYGLIALFSGIAVLAFAICICICTKLKKNKQYDEQVDAKGRQDIINADLSDDVRASEIDIELNRVAEAKNYQTPAFP